MNIVNTIGDNNLVVVNSNNIVVHITQLQQNKIIPKYFTHTSKIDIFEGRTEYFDRISSHFQNENSLILASGEAGIGKTAIAQEYLHRYEKDFSHIIWLNCTSDIQSAFLNSTIAKTLEIIFDPNESLDKIFELLTIALKNIEGNNLLVLDNVDNPDEIVEHYKNGTFNLNDWKIIITTRTLPSFFSSKNLVRVDLLDENEAITLFHRLYTQEPVQSGTKIILELIDRHTLTLEILARNLNILYTLGYTLADMRKDLQEGVLRFPKSHPIQISYNRTKGKIDLLSLLNAVFKATNKNENEKFVLSVFSLLPSIELPYVVLNDLLNMDNEKPETKLGETIFNLIEQGWISPNRKMHKITQELIREQLRPHISNHIVLVKSLTKKINVDYNQGDFLEKSQWIEYAFFFSKKILGINEDLINLKSALGSLHRDLGNYDIAISILDETHIQALISLDANSVSLAWVKSNFGLALWNYGDFTRAESLLIEALNIKLQHFSEISPEVATTQNNLGITYIYLGKSYKAKELLEKALKTDTEHYGEESGIVTMDMNNLGRVYQDLGLYEKAISIYEKAIQIDNILHKTETDNPNLAYRWSNLGSVYLDFGKLKENQELLYSAKNYLERAIELNIKHFGKNNGNTASMMTTLGEVYRNLCSYEQSLETLRESLLLKESIFGYKNPRIFPTQNYLALLFSNMHDFEKAIQLLKSSLNDTFKHSPDNDYNIARHYEDLAMVYNLWNKLEESNDYLLKAIDLYEKCFNGNHPKIDKLKILSKQYPSV